MEEATGYRPLESDQNIHTADSKWLLNDIHQPALEHCIDLDLGFTPATNILQLRRIVLAEAADLSVAWPVLPDGTLDVLARRHERQMEATYWHEVPRFKYATLLDVTPNGFICHYPMLWKAAC